jgi:hypothetical protein
MPMFEELGWDVYNRSGYAEAYKDVVHQHTLRSGFGTEAPDYCFRIGGTPKFFLEAKKPSVSIGTDIAPAFQLRRYAWTAKLSLSVLTDFEEFAVYDSRCKPVLTDKASTSRIQYMPYDQYIDRWDEIESVFSREAVLRGSFDKYALSATGKHGTTSVDAEFLAEIEEWRDSLARNIALRNKGLTTRELNFAVQRTIDRILFLRICEDRGIEDYGRLQALLNGVNTWQRLFEIFEQADQRYNSGLFHFRKERERDIPDELTPGLSMDDKVLKGIISRLYYPECPYEFSVLPADILGQVYEQFLGKVIRLTPGHQAKVEDKPEVKKAGGVYYTPTYIVEYIVKNAVGRLLEDCRKPKDVEKLRILDPACGSGSFLIVAFQKLLDWHLDWYSKNSPEELAKKASPSVYQAQHLDPDGAPRWTLTTSEKKRILLNGIYGVDIDSQAVEVTKLSLMLKVLEGENEQSINTQMKLFHERVLPDLGSNIKCGNSLIGSDFYDGRQLGFLDQEEMYRVNVFDWKRAFPSIMEAGGFDAVIGNPPYVRQESLGMEFKGYAKAHFKTYAGTADLYTYFIERSYDLLRHGGLFSFIVSNKWLKANYGLALRSWMKGRGLEEIVDFGDLPVFQKATTYPCIIRMKKAADAGDVLAARMPSLDFIDLGERVRELGHLVSTHSLRDEGWTLAGATEQNLLDKMREAGVPLGEYLPGRIFRGVLTGLNAAFVIDEFRSAQLIHTDHSTTKFLHAFAMGKNIKRFAPITSKQNLLLIPSGFTRANWPAVRDPWDAFSGEYPAIAEHLLPFKAAAEKRWDKGEFWWELRSCDYYDLFEKPKILWPQIASSARFTIDLAKYVTNDKVFCIHSDDLYLLGLLNSALLKKAIHSVCTDLQGNSFNFSGVFMQRVPIRRIDPSSTKEDKTRADRVSELTQQMLDLHKQRADAKTQYEVDTLKRQIEATDRRIDQLVYELYGLTDAEIAIVEDIE